MRLFLAFDTSSDHLALGLGDLDAPGAVVAAMDFPAPRAANTVVLGAAERLLAGAGAAPRDLHAVAIGRGPGSFTGVRIGAATAKGLAHGLGVPLVGFGTLDAVADRATVAIGRAAQPGALIGVLGDAMRGEAYPALFRLEAAAGSGHPIPRRLTGDRVVRPAEIAAEWAALGEPVTITGGALLKHREIFAETLGTAARFLPQAQWAPDGGSLIAAGWRATGPLTLAAIEGLEPAEAFRAAHPAVLLPIYTRLADAEEAERLRLGAPDVPRANGVAGREPSGTSGAVRADAGTPGADTGAPSSGGAL